MYQFKTKPYQHQHDAWSRSWQSQYWALFAEMGCVDAETEYLSPAGWKRIADYAGGPVAQFLLDGRAEFVEPLAYVRKPCAEMRHFSSARGLDQMLSDDHRMLVLRSDKSRKSHNDRIYKRVGDGPSGVFIGGKDTAWYETTPELFTQHAQRMAHVWPVFEGCHGKGISLTEAEIRVQVAFHADGSFHMKDLSSVGPNRKGTVRIKRPRKIERMKMLLERAQIPYEVRPAKDGFVRIIFLPPKVSKTYGPEWWAATEVQKRIIAEEVFHWDSPEPVSRKTYASVHKSDADFIQFCLASTGQRSTVRWASDGTWRVHAVGEGRTSELVCIQPKAETVPTSDGQMYCFHVPSTYLVLRRNGCIFVTGNTGKTKITIDTIGALYEAGRIEAALILAPKGVFDNWVSSEIPTHLPERIPHEVMRWQPNITKGYREKLRDFALSSPTRAKKLRIFVMNIEALSTPKGADTAMAFLKHNPECIAVVDESTAIKNRQAKRTKNIVKVGRAAKYCRILTGSPITKSPMDLFSQCDFLAEKCLGFNSFFAYQSRYAVTQTRKMGNKSFQEIVGYRRLDELNEKLEAFSTRILKEDCLDLPAKIYQRRNVPLSDEQAKAYVQMKQLALAQLDNGELATTQSVLTQLMRLQQICCGFLTSDEGTVVELKNNRLDELLDIVDETQGKVIIWATWTHDIEKITETLRRRFGPESAAPYYGATSDHDRRAAVRDFQDPDHPLRFFISNKTGAYGLTLTQAKTMIYYSNSYDLEVRLQSEDRAHRIGQTANVTYIDIVAPKTVDEKIIKALRSKINIASQVLGEDVRAWLS